MSLRVTNAHTGRKEDRQGVLIGAGPWNGTTGNGAFTHRLPTQNLRTSWLGSMNTYSEGQMVNGGKRVSATVKKEMNSLIKKSAT